MTISTALQAKIDTLEDPNLRARILRVLLGPGKKRATDEEIYETIVSAYTKATAQQARLRKWRDDEVEAFAQYFKEERPEDYFEFLQQERDFNEIEPGFAWGVRQLIWQWIPDLSSADCGELFSRFRDHAKSQLS